MPRNEAEIETEIRAKGKTAPRLTPADIDAQIVSEFYFTAADGLFGASAMRPQPGGHVECLNRLTICVLVLRNGFTVIGESSCVLSENFDAEIGRKIARDNARNKIWQLEGYALRSRLVAAA